MRASTNVTNAKYVARSLARPIHTKSAAPLSREELRTSRCSLFHWMPFTSKMCYQQLRAPDLGSAAERQYQICNACSWCACVGGWLVGCALAALVTLVFFFLNQFISRPAATAARHHLQMKCPRLCPCPSICATIRYWRRARQASKGTQCKRLLLVFHNKSLSLMGNLIDVTPH